MDADCVITARRVAARDFRSLLFVLVLSSACSDEESCPFMMTDIAYEGGELVFVMSEAEAVSRANAEAWSRHRTDEAARDAGREAATDAEDPPPTRVRSPIFARGGPAFNPATPCNEGTCVEARNDYATFRFVRPTAKGTYPLRDLHATLCEVGSECPMR